ncbi:MAG: hypothetical protein ACUVRZ_08460 [Desulfobacca sp.]|uniref:hypothetical protein n=1 Tax=Desulfobacca sp. TaxID=2067990 RepID=UPI00404B98A3
MAEIQEIPTAPWRHGAAAGQGAAQASGPVSVNHPPIRLRRVPWLIPAWAQAQAWPRLILIRRGVPLTEDLLAHELAHVEQWHRLGTLLFVWRYCRDFWRYGYAAHPLEEEARAAAADPQYRRRARLLLQERGRGTTPQVVA